MKRGAMGVRLPAIFDPLLTLSKGTDDLGVLRAAVALGLSSQPRLQILRKPHQDWFAIIHHCLLVAHGIAVGMIYFQRHSLMIPLRERKVRHFAMMTERIPQDADKFLLRMPEGMRDRIKLAAERNNRSMNSEIISALERAFPEASGAGDALGDAAEALEELRRVLERHGLV